MAPRTHLRGMMTMVTLVCLAGGVGLMLSALFDENGSNNAAPPSLAPPVNEVFPEYFRDQDPSVQEEMVRELRPWPEVYNYGNKRPSDPLTALLALDAGKGGVPTRDFATASQIPAAAAAISPSRALLNAISSVTSSSVSSAE